MAKVADESLREAAKAPGQQVMAGTDIFKGKGKVLIKQEFAWAELCGIEARNRYRISEPKGTEEGDVFLYMNEESKCLERICCKTARSLKMMVHEGSTKDGPVLMNMKKSLHWPGNCPCCRPHFDVYSGNDDTNKIGSIDDPCRCCCKIDQQVKDPSGKVLFTTLGSTCSMGIFCPMCFDVKIKMMKEGNQVGSIDKLKLSCAEVCKKTNRFMIDMEQLPDPEERKLALATAMLLDLQYFEQEQKN